jgi:hypothetical protein
MYRYAEEKAALAFWEGASGARLIPGFRAI